MTPPVAPKIYHIVHVDRLSSIISQGLLCDALVSNSELPGTGIGINRIKTRRLNELRLASHPNLYIGQCVPFYFCPRSIMLYLIYRANNPGLVYTGGQKSIIHLVADLHKVVAWAEQNRLRWAFTLSNAGSYIFQDRSDLSQLGEINWAAVQATKWSGEGISSDISEGKQAEFLLENRFSWELIEYIGVYSLQVLEQVMEILPANQHQPKAGIEQAWYY